MTEHRDWTAFSSWQAYTQFASEVIHRRRYLFGSTINGFLDALSTDAEKRVSLMPEGTELWRAQRGCLEHALSDPAGVVYSPYPVERMKPLRDKAHEGRVNPKGIPCLYCATAPHTSMAEVRAGIGEHITLAQMHVRRALRLVDCTREHAAMTLPEMFDELDQGRVQDVVWNDLNNAFSAPVGRLEDHAEYAPTQVIGELFKSAGFDGIIYRSAFRERGHNVALFDLDAATVEGRWVYRVDAISHVHSVVAAEPGPASPTLRGSSGSPAR